MKKSNEPREWWLKKFGNWWSETDPSHDAVQVIEKSAYSYAVDQWDYWVEEARKAQTELVAAKAEIERLNAKASEQRYRRVFGSIEECQDFYCRELVQANLEIEELKKLAGFVQGGQPNQIPLLKMDLDRANKRITELDSLMALEKGSNGVHRKDFIETIDKLTKAMERIAELEKENKALDDHFVSKTEYDAQDEQIDKYEKALQHYARQTESEEYFCPGSHSYYSSMHPNADVTCPHCGESEDGLGRNLYRTVPAKSGEVARKALGDKK